ncbi:hypothetical protein C900_04922 [Fulvivirga imtechensis AK7]|uniref:Transmembrane protein n=1 Tax=Fulvivirga imtechensis AK7 TaxID=1237149 RepID=L8JPV2_9BACT|nr:phage holin family protein [Fulvivirga imtechensis]ELR69534.1 hypothetical protein C900_04922 [Fulvivirga imtechensis AK7]
MSILTSLIRKPINYVEHRIADAKEHIREEIAEKVSQVIVYAALGILMFFFTLFVSIGLAVLFNVWLETAVWGYFIVGGIYLLLFGILFLIRKKDYLARKARQYADYFVKGIYRA